MFRVLLVVFATPLLMWFAYYYKTELRRLGSATKENLIENPSFESGFDLWDYKINEGAYPIVLAGNKSLVFYMDAGLVANGVSFTYHPLKFTGPLSKVTLRFEFYKPNDISHSCCVITYVLSGTGDHGMYQNSVVDSVTYTTVVLDTRVGEMNELKLYPLKDFAEKGLEGEGRTLARNDVNGKVYVLISSVQDSADGVVEAEFYKLGESFINHSSPTISLVEDDKNFAAIEPKNLQEKLGNLASDGNKAAGICTPYLSNVIFLRKLHDLQTGKYLFSADINTISGIGSPLIRLKTDRETTSFRPNKFQSQTNWLRIFGIVNVGKEAEIVISFENNNNSNSSNCYNLDNISLYKLPNLPVFLYRKDLEEAVNMGRKEEAANFYTRRLKINELLDAKQALNIEKLYSDLQVPVYRLYFNEDDFYTKNSLEEYTKARFVYGGKEYNVKIKLRGDTPIHWVAPVKSFRLVFDKQAPFEGKEALNLVNPASRGYLTESLSYHVAQKLGLPYLENKFVYLIINDKPYSILFELEQWSAGLLERNQLPVGNLYGELNIDTDLRPPFLRVGWQILFKGFQSRTVLDWMKYVSDPEYDKKDFSSMFALTESVSLGDREIFDSLVRTDAAIKWDVHSVLTGSAHQDTVHNLRLFYDNTYGVFVPIPWDVRMNMQIGEGPLNANKGDYLINPITDLVNSNPRDFIKRNQLLKEYLNEKNQTEDVAYYKKLVDSTDTALRLSRFYAGENGESPFGYDGLNINAQIELLPSHREAVLNLISRKPQLKVAINRISDPNPLYSIDISSDPGVADFSPVTLKSLAIGTKDLNPRYFLEDGKEITCADGNCDLIVPSNFYYKLIDERAPAILSEEAYNTIINAGLLNEEELNDFKAAYTKVEFKPYYSINTDPKYHFRVSYFKKLGLIKPYRGLSILVKLENAVLVKDLVKSLRIKVWDPVNDEYIQNIKYEVTEKVVENKAFTALDQKPVFTTLSLDDVLKYSPTEVKERVNLQFLNDLKLFNSLKNLSNFEKRYRRFLLKDKDNPKKFYLKKGDYVIDSTVVVPVGVEVMIEAGTRLFFGETASFLVFGKLEAVGNPDGRIIFTARDKSKGWGVLGILRPDAYAKLVNCDIEYGNQAKFMGINMSGMVSAYHSTLILKDSKISWASIQGGDDGVNAKYGKAIIENNRFEGNKSDALDFDFVKEGSTLANNVFVDSGGDGMDISGTKGLTISGNKIYKSGDKGISLGEGTDVTLEKNLISDANFGIAVKDSSKGECLSGSIDNVNIGMAAYNKKEIFGGGVMWNRDCSIKSKKQDYGLEVFDKSDFRYGLDSYVSNILNSKEGCELLNHNLTIKEVIKVPDKMPSSKKKLLKAILENGLESLGYKYAILNNSCQHYDGKN